MTAYIAPIEEQLFVLDTIACLFSAERPRDVRAISDDDAKLILAQSGVLASEIFAPLNEVGDRSGAKLADGRVTTPAGFQKAYKKYLEGGWSSLEADETFGGQGLPFSFSSAVQEQFASANMALSLIFTLSQGAVVAIAAHATPEQKMRYLPRLISGDWSATMNLTEPQAGSNLGAIRTRAEPIGEGQYAITGNKIFITFGDHDLTDNIIHLVLARLPGSPEGTRGISLFIVPKTLSSGVRNDVHCTGLERKMGLHASPTCAMSFGGDGACVGELVGEPNGGMRVMFSMMNHARIGVGIQGVAIAERAFQSAARYARERVQGRPIIEFADVRRMLMLMRANTEAVRAIVYFTAAAVDKAHSGDRSAQSLADLLTPIAKAYASDTGVEVTSLGMQIMGGFGFVEEAGMARLYRDIRIAPIYEGTNGIQALDLVLRKLPERRWEPLFEQIRSAAISNDIMLKAVNTLEDVTHWILKNPDQAAAGATPYLRLFGTVLGGHLLDQQAAIARERLANNSGNRRFLEAKGVTAAFFRENILSGAEAMRGPIVAGNELLFALDESDLCPA